MNHDVMTGMLWAALFMVGVPLAIGIGVLVMVIRRRGPSDDRVPDRGA
ncbi:MAG: hypothetical protein ACREK2_00990 [Gemmatimonadota bacterium]